MEVNLRTGDRVVRVELAAGAGGRQRRCRVDGEREYEIEVLHAARDDLIFAADGRIVRALIARRGTTVLVAVGGVVHEFSLAAGTSPTAGRPRPAASGRIVAPMPGKVLNVLVRPGQEVEAGQPLVILEAMKMEHTLTAEGAGTVSSVLVEAGDMVEGAQLLLEITVPAGAP